MSPARPLSSPLRSCRAHLAALAAILLAATAVSAADTDGNYAVWGAGARSCHTFNGRGEDTAQDYRQYVMGYLTAYNALANETYSISADQDIEAVMAWLAGYCADKPMHSFDQALVDFTASHAGDRLKRPPGRLGW